MSEWLTQRWPEGLQELDLRFRPVPLASGDPEVPDAEPWGLTVGPLALHPIVKAGEGYNPHTVTRWRVSAQESGGVIADFYRFEQAVGFATEAKDWDWSGTRAEAEKIVARLKKRVARAYKKWSNFGFGGSGGTT